jgi:plastocyanin
VRRGGLLALGGGLAVAVTAAGCGASHPDVLNGKQQFVSHCGACHTLARAGTKGVTGPNLDAAFAQARRDGEKSSTFQGMVAGQIDHPSRVNQTDPATGKELPLMPPHLVTGQDALDLATVGQSQSKGTAQEKGGVVDIPTDTGGQLAYQYKDAAAKAGKVTLESKNAAPVGHNIAVEGNGVSAKGQVVQGGATSRVQVTLKPGTYTFFCSVPGHREAGMQGKLTVK